MLVSKISISAAILSVAMLSQTSCDDTPREPQNIITDTEGLRIDLKWATGKNEPTALTDVDLDLDVVNNKGEILSSYNKSEFEHIELTSILEDGTYTVKVSLFEIYKKGRYTLSITGATSGKNFNASGVLKDGFLSSIDVLRIVKSGEKFTMTII